MSYTIQYLKEEDIIFVTNAGEFTHDDFKSQAIETLEISIKNNCNKILVDCNSMIIKSSTVDIYETAYEYEKINAPKSNKIALIIDKEETKAKLKFYETVCNNRGWHIKIFKNKKLALDWLRK